MKKETISELTKKQLATALFKLMREKPIEKISIHGITDECGFPRSTFYYHFDDIYDLAAWALAQETVRLLRAGDDGHALLWGDSLLCLFENCKANYKVLRGVVNSTSFWRISDHYCTYCVNAIAPDLAAAIPEAAQVDQEFLRFLTAFYGHSMLDVCVKWFRGDMTSSPDEMVALLDVIIKNNFLGTLAAYTITPDLRVPLQVQHQNLHSLA
jgi:AcrR family transcriptional regulator